MCVRREHHAGVSATLIATRLKAVAPMGRDDGSEADKALRKPSVCPAVSEPAQMSARQKRNRPCPVISRIRPWASIQTKLR